jgi:hypothetical protein
MAASLPQDEPANFGRPAPWPERCGRPFRRYVDPVYADFLQDDYAKNFLKPYIIIRTASYFRE